MLGISLDVSTQNEILEKIKKCSSDFEEFWHIVSLNPEILVAAKHDKEFAEVLNRATMRIADGVGLKYAVSILKKQQFERVAGVDLMAKLIPHATDLGLPVVLIGGDTDVAEDLSECYQKQYPKAKFIGLQGVKNIKNPLKMEEEEVFTKVYDIVAVRRPCLVFVSFGSPQQEKWIWSHQEQFKGCIVMGVGGAFDFLSGRVRRAPVWIRNIGLEWLFRLIIQPWRWKRQVRLIEFLFLILQEKFRG
jgi:N-acetylglucosaminyldiphosphoundecaprenol N-acetyl-beta-D-mannosaminyltransferase